VVLAAARRDRHSGGLWHGEGEGLVGDPFDSRPTRMGLLRDNRTTRCTRDSPPIAYRGFTTLTCSSAMLTWIAGRASLRTVASVLSDERNRRWAASIRR
jgi:hypothetical protein